MSSLWITTIPEHVSITGIRASNNGGWEKGIIIFPWTDIKGQ